MAVVERERQSIVAPESIDWAAREAELHEGGGGNFDGGNHNDDDGGGDGWRREPNGDISSGTAFGLLGGLTMGLFVGGVSVKSYDAIAINNFKSAHGKVLAETLAPTHNIDYTKIPNKNAELGAFGAPILILTALGIVIGRKIENRLRG